MRDRSWGDQSKSPGAIDCVQFVIAVVGECCAQSQQSSKFDAELRRRIAIDNIQPDEKLDALVEAGDDRIRGVQWALVAANLGEAISIADAQPGDFVQYWYRSGESWAGHTAVIQSIADGQAILLGAHRTILARQQQQPVAQRTGGVGESIPVRLSDPAKKVYVARWRHES